MRRWNRMGVPALLLLSAGIAPPDCSAQEFLDIGSIRICSECRLALHVEAALGEASGGGVIESDEAVVVFGDVAERFAVFHVGTSEVLLFDSGGRYVRRVGRAGSGPGEIRTLVDAHFRGSDLVTLDFAGPRFTIYDEDGERIQDALAGIRPGRFRVVSESVAVVGSMDRRPALAGYPLHSIDLNTGEQLRHFGSTNGEWSASGPFAQDVVLGYAMEPQVVWHGQRSQLLLEEWHVDDGLVRHITGELQWLRQGSAAERGPPQPYLLSFGWMPGTGCGWSSGYRIRSGAPFSRGARKASSSMRTCRSTSIRASTCSTCVRGVISDRFSGTNRTRASL